MSPLKLLRAHRVRFLAGLSGLVSIVFVALCAAQAPAPLTITTPISGAVVTPGQPLAITVTIASGTYPNGIAIFGQAPFGVTGIQSVTGSVVFFSLPTPANTPPGSYRLTAVGTNASGTLVSSASINVLVEMQGSPTTLS